MRQMGSYPCDVLLHPHMLTKRLHASKNNATLATMGGYSCSFSEYNLKLDNRKK